jgi:nucleosome assembly protein 1-like 1
MFTVFQGQYDKLEAKFFEERAALEDKYQKLYEPLCSKVSLFVY